MSDKNQEEADELTIKEYSFKHEVIEVRLILSILYSNINNNIRNLK